MIFFLVKKPDTNVVVLTTAIGREDAKRKAAVFLGGNPDHYIVTPLTQEGDRVKVEVFYP